MINKTYIIGGGRSGKSFLAGQIYKKTGMRHYDLDDVVFIEIGRVERDELSRNKELDKILLSDSWIIEGAYAEEWIVSALNDADIIIWLDTPVTVKLLRFFKKIIADGINSPKNFYARGKLVAGLKHKEWDRSRQCYRRLLEPFKEKTIILKSKREINKFLSSRI